MCGSPHLTDAKDMVTSGVSVFRKTHTRRTVNSATNADTSPTPDLLELHTEWFHELKRIARDYDT